MGCRPLAITQQNITNGNHIFWNVPLPAQLLAIFCSKNLVSPTNVTSPNVQEMGS